MAFDHNFRISVFYLSVLHFLSCIVMVSADCSWSEETMGWCKTHKIFLGQYSTSQIVSSSYYRKEFHKISSTPRVKDKVLRLRWISSSFSSKDALVFRIGCTNAKTVIKDFHKSDKPHDIYSHDGCIEIERNSISNSETDRTSFTVIAELINMAEIHRSCSSYPSTSNGDESGVIISQNWPSTETVKSSFNCVWELRTDSSKAFQINIMDMDLGVLTLFSRNYCTDTITIEESGYEYYPEFEKTYRCDPDGRNADGHEKSLKTGSSRLKIIFKRISEPSDGHEGRGFVIGWTAYKKSHSTPYNPGNSTTFSTKSNSILYAIISAVIFSVVFSLICGCRYRQMRARSAAVARQRGQQAQVMAHYNRERVAEISNNNNNNHNNTNLQQMNITEIGRSNHGINLPFYLPPPQYTEVAQSGQPPPSYNEKVIFSSQAPSLHQNQGGERGGIPSPLELTPPAVLPYPPLQATGYQLAPSYQPSVVVSQQ